MHTNIKRTSLTKRDVYTAVCLASQNRAYTSYIRGSRCKTEEDFFREVSASFQFPYYFGENWPAFDECICDLEWLNVSSIFVVVDDFSLIFSEQKEFQELLKGRLIHYFEIMVGYWESEKISVEVWLNN